MNDIEKLKNMSRLKTITLEDEEGTKTDFKIRSMKTHEILRIMDSWGDKNAKEMEKLTPEEIEMKEFSNYIQAVVDSSKSILSRSYPELTEDEVEEIISNNLQAFMKFTQEQKSKFFRSDDTRNVKRLRHAKKKASK
jgi:hypothetical protein